MTGGPAGAVAVAAGAAPDRAVPAGGATGAVIAGAAGAVLAGAAAGAVTAGPAGAVPAVPAGAVTGGPAGAVPAVPAGGAGWDAARWRRILDRLEHRDPEVGLRFSGPPLWLEVTMRGPDSADWAVAGAGGRPERSWDWEAAAVCDDAMDLCRRGAGDDELLLAASRYTLLNAVLNLTHELGEWLRFDGQRVFPAHGGPRAPSGPYWAMAGDGPQGNGAVLVEIEHQPATLPARPAAPASVTARARSVAAAWRFTALPGTEVAYSAAGPHLAGRPGDRPGRWSPDTVAARDGAEGPFVAAVQRDVHRMLLLAGADRVCRALHVDGRQAWRLAGTAPGGPGSPVAVRVTYPE